MSRSHLPPKDIESKFSDEITVGWGRGCYHGVTLPHPPLATSLPLDSFSLLHCIYMYLHKSLGVEIKRLENLSTLSASQKWNLLVR